MNTIKRKPYHIELNCNISGQGTDAKEILTATLLNLGYYGFIEDNDILTAYIDTDLFSEKAIGELGIVKTLNIKFDHKPVVEKNWNEEWEKNFNPVILGNICLVRAPFHPPQKEFPCELIIEPKMAFGTGHHPTTAMIAEFLLESDLKDITLFDMGCGSGILGILACKRGAARVEMADNDPDAVKNTIENIERNNAHNAKVHLGGAETIPDLNPGIITANINRPVLMENMSAFFRLLQPGGQLVLSGIIREDVQMITDKASAEGFMLKSTTTWLEWVMCVLRKPEYK